MADQGAKERLTWESRNEALRVESPQLLMPFAACERGYMVDRSMWDLHQDTRSACHGSMIEELLLYTTVVSGG